MPNDKKLITFWANSEIHAMLTAIAEQENQKKSQVMRDLIELAFFRRRMRLEDYREP